MAKESAGRFTVMIDDVSLLEVAANGSADDVLDFLHYCVALTSEMVKKTTRSIKHCQVFFLHDISHSLHLVSCVTRIAHLWSLFTRISIRARMAWGFFCICATLRIL